MDFRHCVSITGIEEWETVPKSRYHITLIGKYLVYEKDWEGYHDFGRLYWCVGGGFPTLEEAQQYVIDGLEKKPDVPEKPGSDPENLDEIVDRMMTDPSFHDSIVGFF